MHPKTLTLLEKMAEKVPEGNQKFAILHDQEIQDFPQACVLIIGDLAKFHYFQQLFTEVEESFGEIPYQEYLLLKNASPVDRPEIYLYESSYEKGEPLQVFEEFFTRNAGYRSDLSTYLPLTDELEQKLHEIISSDELIEKEIISEHTRFSVNDTSFCVDAITSVDYDYAEIHMSFEKDTILLGCASFTDTYIHMNYKTIDDTGNFYKIVLTGFEGGHSGSMIDKHLGNSNVLLAKLLLEINDIKVSKFTGGNKLNVIPTYTEAIIKTNLDINSYVNKFINENSLNYPGLVINVETVTGSNRILTLEDSKLFLDSVANFKNGVINKNNRGEVTTSENLGIVNLSDNILGIGLRSSIEEERLVILDYFNNYCNKYNYKLDIWGYQPGFTTSEDSLLVKDLIKAYKELNNSEPNLKSVHIGLEVAFFKNYIKDLEAVVISSDIIDPHAPSERVSIESIKRCDEWLQRYLTNK